MAWLDQRNGRYSVCFRLGDRKYKKSLKTKSERLANQLLGRVEENLALIARGRLTVPENADVALFLISDGKFTGATAPIPAPKKRPKSISQVFEEYRNDLPEGALESNSLKTAKIHIDHLQRYFGRKPLRDLSREDLQNYIHKRLGQEGRRGKVMPITIRKELATLRTIWNFAASLGETTNPFPNRPKLKYPKKRDKPRFHTREEVARIIRRGGISEREQDELWDAVFLTLEEIEELVTHVSETARHPFLFPMILTAAHTGARRSELLRSRIGDVDFESNTLTIREKKRVRGTDSTRTVPLSQRLGTVLRDWIANHPGGQFTFSLCGKPLTVNQAHDHWKRTMADSEWSVLRGYHVLRHSFASNAAAQGVDQRIINSWMGHQTEEMVRRYRHLFPNQQHEAIQSIFGGE